MLIAKEKKALKAIHRLLQQGRWLAGEDMRSQELYTYFDELDGLMGYIVSWPDEDKSTFFEKELERVCTNFKALHIFEDFKRE